ncbi:MAG: FIST N-terminal domain-containing protein [Candidatus ainarchaeum sp.]|nr:FIST N-terminal domain-containing protein [Candidatus ainarchaeum sp.]
MLEAAVGVSRNWDPFIAGMDVAEKVLSKLSAEPKFVLLFATIHYEKNGGFERLLAGFHSKLPPNVPLVGGTVSGATTPDGCFTRGAFAAAVSGDKVEALPSIGFNVKRDPRAAAARCADGARAVSCRGERKTKFTFANVSNGTIPPMPFFGRKRILRMPFGRVALLFLETVGSFMQYGVGRETEFFNEFSKRMPDSTILFASNYDNNRSLSNYQFFNHEVHMNAAAAMSIAVDADFVTNATFGLKPTNVKFKISHVGLHGCSFGRVDGKNATNRVCELLGWPEGYLNEYVYRRTYYYPLVSSHDGMIYPHVMGLFIGHHVVCTYKFDTDDIEVYSASGSSMLGAVKENLEMIPKDKKPVLGLGVECTARLEALGSEINKVRDEMDKTFKGAPYLVVYTAGEGLYKPGKPASFFNESFILSTLLV